MYRIINLLLVLLCLTAALAQSAPDAQALIAREERLLQDEEQQRLDAVRAEVAPDALLIDANGAVYTTATLMQSLRAGRPRQRTPENISARPLGADAWIVSFEFQLAPMQPNQRAHRFRVSSIWKQQDGTWKLAWRQSTPIAR